MKYKNHKRLYFRKQKICGVALIILSVISALLLDGDITVALILVPLGLYAIFTKKKILLNDYFYKTSNKDDREL